MSQAETNAGPTTFTFAVTLTAPAGPGGVTFDIATADGTAQDDNPASEDNDYVAQSLTGQSIPSGSTGPYNFNVTVNGDTTAEANETFFVNVTNITGANAGDTQGQGTIQNDDVTLTAIRDIQGRGASSPIVGASVTTRGIVTGVRSNGFFIEEPDATFDADPATSEGIFVFTSGAPPAAAAVGFLVQVAGTVAEFVPSNDPLQPPLTQLTSPTVAVISTGNPLPSPVPLTATFPDPAGPHDQLERLEGMRVSVSSLTVVGPTAGSVSEANASATSTGVFYGVVTGVARPFREPGIQAPDPAPAGGSIPPIPRFDSNPERLRVDSDGLAGGPLIDAGTGAVVTGLTGPLDYGSRAYTILPDPFASIGVAGGPAPAAATQATAREFTAASFNLQRFYDAADDPAVSEPVLTAAAFDRRLAKASLAVRNFMRAPDVIGVQEVENLTTLQALAARISSDAAAAGQTDPQYAAYLVEGNDPNGGDVGFLVKTAPVAASTPRVEVVEVQQELDGTLFVNPDSSTETLNDRPPLRLNAVVHHPNGRSFAVTVIVNHLRTLEEANSQAPGSNGWPTVGARVRAKRQEQAEDLANLVQARQTADPAERIILAGDFNAFEFNDGLADLLNVIAGTPPPDNQTAVPGDGVDLVNPDLDNLSDTPPPAQRYGHVGEGNAQNLDHVLVNQAFISGTVARRVEHARVNADFPETARNDGTTPTRLSEHDPLIGYFQVADFSTADLSITKSDGSDPVTAGTELTYTITVTNGGPDDAASVSVSDTLPAGTTFVSLAAPGGWTCTTPAAGAGGTVTCAIPTLPVGNAVFTLKVAVAFSATDGTVISNTASVSSDTADQNTGAESDTETTTVSAPPADISANDAAAAEPASAGSQMIFTVTLASPAVGPGATVNYATADQTPAGAGRATGGASCDGTSDYETASGMLTFAPGERIKTVAVSICADADAGEPDETFFLNLSGPTGGSVARAQATGTITASNPAGAVLISELRTSGPDPDGPANPLTGAANDFVELYNNSDNAVTVPVGGWGIFQQGAACTDTPVLIAAIPAGEVIPARGHYLVAGAEYQSGALNAVAAPNRTFDSPLEADRNVGLFSTANVSQLSTITRLDAVGFGSNAGGNCDLLGEGAPLAATAGSAAEHSYFRRLAAGRPSDTGANSSEFLLVSTDYSVINGTQSALGAPGPERTTSPVQRNDKIKSSLIEQSQSNQSPPNSVRRQCGQTPDQAPETCDPAFAREGTFSIRRRWTNKTGASVTRLRFRLVNVTAGPAPSGTADLRAITSQRVTEGAITVEGTTVEAPAQGLGGGYNSTLAVGTIDLTADPLVPDETIVVQFLLGVQQGGAYAFFVNAEAGPPPTGPAAPAKMISQPAKDGGKAGAMGRGR